MLKLYLKKLILVLGVILEWIAISAVIVMVCGFSRQPEINSFTYLMCMIASGVVTAVLVGVVKVKESRRKTEYLTATQLQQVKFWREILDIVKSKPFIAELLAFITWLVPLMVYVCQLPDIAVDTPDVLIKTSIFVIVVFTAAFALVDLVVSFFTRKLWMRGH